MARDNRWESLLDPGKATNFFECSGDRPRFAPDATPWDTGQAWWCSEISRTIYRRDHRAEYFERAGLREESYFDAGSTQGALVLGAAHAVLVFRGSADLRDWLTNLQFRPVETTGGGRVHRGFARGLERVWDEIAPRLEALRLPTFVTGHSLGGALATIAAAKHPFVAAYTFGAPRVGDEEFWTTMRAPVHRVVHDRDLVPRLPTRQLGYFDGGILRRLGSPEAGSGDADSSELESVDRSLRERRWYEPDPRLADHAPINYSASLVRLI